MRTPSGIARCVARTGVVEQHADGRRGGVIELAGANGPDESSEKAAGHQAAGDDEQDDHAHAGSAPRADQRMAPTLMPTMVSELAGIRMAVASGVSSPASASDRPADVVGERQREADHDDVPGAARVLQDTAAAPRSGRRA